MDSYLRRGDVSLHLRDYGGRGLPIVLVHGLGGSLANWEAIGPRLSEWGHTVAMDLPGFGLSPPGPDWELSTHAGAVRSVIAHLGGRAVLIGNSMGGLITEMVASSSPEAIEGLVLVAPATPPTFPDPRIHWPTARRLALQATPVLGRAMSRYFLRRYTAEELVRLSLSTIAHDPGRVPPDVVVELTDLARARAMLPWAEEAVSRTGRSITGMLVRRSRFVAMVRDITAPTLVLHGLTDHIVSPTSVEWLCSLRPDWDLVQMADTGHIPMLDAPVRFLGVLVPWLQKLVGRENLTTTSL